jgi:hypothetical protein
MKNVPAGHLRPAASNDLPCTVARPPASRKSIILGHTESPGATRTPYAFAGTSIAAEPAAFATTAVQSAAEVDATVCASTPYAKGSDHAVMS